MGQALIKEPLLPYNKKLIFYLKNKKIKDIYDSIEIIRDNYSTNNMLTLDEFTDVFGGVLDEFLDEIFVQLTNKKDINAHVDVYESLAIFAILCGDELEEKL